MNDVTPTNRPSLPVRVKQWCERHGRGLTVANIFTQGGIIVTGGVVRLTDSGLGCSTFPQCEPGSFTPEVTSEHGLHPYIEFGNRLLTFVLLAVAVGVLLAVWKQRPELRVLGVIPVAGTVVQALLGGLVVLSTLHPSLVAAHLLISLVLVWFAVQLALRYRHAPRRAGRCIKKTMRLSVLALVVLMVLGALTTGAGPHSGDYDATVRLALDPAQVARAHAFSVWIYLVIAGTIVARVWRHRSMGERDEVRRAWTVWVAVIVLQGAIGYVQYFTGLPELLVALHLAGAAILTAAHSAAFYLLRRARPVTAS